MPHRLGRQERVLEVALLAVVLYPPRGHQIHLGCRSEGLRDRAGSGRDFKRARKVIQRKEGKGLQSSSTGGGSIGYVPISVVVEAMGINVDGAPCEVVGVVVTSDPLITPLVASSFFPVIPFDDVGIETLGLAPGRGRCVPRKKRRRR